jgi:hypothetical protein
LEDLELEKIKDFCYFCGDNFPFWEIITNTHIWDKYLAINFQFDQSPYPAIGFPSPGHQSPYMLQNTPGEMLGTPAVYPCGVLWVTWARWRLSCKIKLKVM